MIWWFKLKNKSWYFEYSWLNIFMLWQETCSTFMEILNIIHIITTVSCFLKWYNLDKLNESFASLKQKSYELDENILMLSTCAIDLSTSCIITFWPKFVLEFVTLQYHFGIWAERILRQFFNFVISFYELSLLLKQNALWHALYIV